MGLTALERVGSYIWNPIRPVFTEFTARSGYFNKLLLGLMWGFLPCGLVYSVLGWSLATADPVRSALLMGSFGLGTLPAMVASGLSGQALMRKLREKGVRIVIGVLLIAFGLWTMVSPLRHMAMTGGEHAQHAM
jgi:sulfite exporter TauE/SafE